MTKLVLNDITTFSNDASAASLVNANSSAIEAAVENTLSRDGTTPNQMGADIDLDSNDLLNVGTLGAGNVNSNTIEANTIVATTINATTALLLNGVPVALAPLGGGLPRGGSANQVLSKIDGSDYNTQWTTPASPGGSGTVTSFSIVAANGFNGSVSNASTTPALTITTSVTGIVKGNGTALSAATAGTDYQAPLSLTTSGSGAATLISNVLNIPTPSGGGTGTVTSVTSADANATVATTTTTPVITIVSAPKWLTARNLAGNSVDGSTNVAFSNKFIVQGTTDSGLSGPQFLGALTTGIVKNTTTTGVLSIATGADLPAMTATVGGAVPTPPNNTTTFLRGDGTFATPAGGGTVANPTATIGLTAVNGTATSAIRSDGAPALSQSISPTMTGNWTFNPASGNGVSINPATGTGLAIASQQSGTGTVSGASPTPGGYAYNHIYVPSDGIDGHGITNAPIKTGLVVDIYPNNNSYGLGQAILGMVWVPTGATINTTDPTMVGYSGINGWGRVDINLGGTNTGAGAAGGVFGLNGVGIAGAGATNLLGVVGMEIDVQTYSGSSMSRRSGITIADQAPSTAQGTTYDAALNITAVGTVVGWRNGILFGPYSGTQPMDATNGVLMATSGAANAKSGVDISSYTFSGSAFKSTGFNVAGNGHVLVNSNSNASPLAGAGSLMQMVGADGAGSTLLYIDDYSGGAVSPTPGAVFRGSRGTSASPTAVSNGDILTFFGARGMQSNGAFSGTSAAVLALASESFTSSANGTDLYFQTTPVGSATKVTAAVVHGSKGLSVGALTDPGASNLSVAGNVQIGAGTTSQAPIQLTSGTNKTTASAGAIEYDGNAFYATSAASSRQVVGAEQVTILSADNTAPTNVATAQNVFPTGQSTLTVQGATTYEFEAEYEIDSTGTTSNALQTLFGGTATFTGITYTVVSTNSSPSTVPATASMRLATVATAISATAAVAAATQRQVYLRGTMRINAAGTIIPQFQYSAAPGAAPIVRANSFFRCWPVGSNTVTSVGNWS